MVLLYARKSESCFVGTFEENVCFFTKMEYRSLFCSHNPRHIVKYLLPTSRILTWNNLSFVDGLLFVVDFPPKVRMKIIDKMAEIE